MPNEVVQHQLAGNGPLQVSWPAHQLLEMCPIVAALKGAGDRGLVLMCCLQEEDSFNITSNCRKQVLQWRETRHMAAAMEGASDSSVFSEAYCARLAASSAPGCRLIEVCNSQCPFLPMLAGQEGPQGDAPSASLQLSLLCNGRI